MFKQLLGFLLLLSFLTVKGSVSFGEQQSKSTIKIHQSQDDAKEGNTEGEKESKESKVPSDELLNIHLTCLSQSAPFEELHIPSAQKLLQQYLPSPYLPPEHQL